MNRNDLLEVVFILDEIMKKKEVVRYTYQDKTLIVWLPSGIREIYNLGDNNDR